MNIKIKERKELKDGNNLKLSDVSNNGNINISEYYFSKNTSFSFLKNVRNTVTFTGCLFEIGVEFIGFEFDESLVFYYCIFCSTVSFSNLKIAGSLSLNHCLTNSKIFIWGNTLNTCFIGSSVAKQIDIKHNKIDSYIDIGTCPIPVSLNQNQITETEFSINDKDFYDFFYQSEIKKEESFHCRFRLKYPFITYENIDNDNKVHKKNDVFGHLKFDSNTGGEIRIRDAIFESIRILNNNKSQIKISAVSVRLLSLSNLINTEQIKINNLIEYKDSLKNKKAGCDFRIYNSITGPITLINCKEKFKNVEIVNSSIHDLKLINSEITPKTLNKRDVSINSEDLYRQFSLIYNNSKNKNYETTYKALADDLLLKKTSLTNFTDYFILWTNKYSNNFGTNWWKAILLLLIFNFFFFLLIEISISRDCLSTCYLMSNCDFCEKNLFLMMIDHSTVYLDLINPFHNLSKSYKPYSINQIDTNFFLSFISLLSRIFTAYFTFQMLRAFRKFI